MEQGKRRNYDPTFKEEAVKLLVERGRGTGAVARELGINATMLGRWKREYLGSRGFPGKGSLPPAEEENRKLLKELTDVKLERDILKKAVGIFSRGPR